MAIVRKSYVHPALIAAARQEPVAKALPGRLPRATRWLSRVERGLLGFPQDPRAAVIVTAN